MKYGILGKGSTQPNQTNAIYELPIDSEADIANVRLYIVNTGDNRQTYKFGFANENQTDNEYVIYDLGELLTKEHIIIGNIMISKGERLIISSSSDDVTFVVQGMEEQQISNLSTDIIKWITSSNLGEIVGENINIKLEATNATSYSLVAGTLPLGTSIDTNGNLQGLNPRNNTKYRFTVRASNGGKMKDQLFSFTAKNRAPVMTTFQHNIPNQLIIGQPITISMSGAVDPDNDNVFYNLTLPVGMIVTPPSKSQGYEDNEQIVLGASSSMNLGDYEIKVVAIDTKGEISEEVIINVEITSADVVPSNLNDIIMTDKELNTVYEALFELKDLEPNYGIWVEVKGGNALLDTFVDNNQNYSGIYDYKKKGITDSNGNLNVKVQMRSPNIFDSSTKTELHVSGLSANFVIGTRQASDNPQGFQFQSKDNQPLDTFITSDIITVYGLEPNYNYNLASVDGTIFASYNINDFNNANYTNRLTVQSSPNGTLMIAAKVLSKNQPDKVSVMTISLGNKVTSFSVRTRLPIETPNTFIFTPITNATPDLDYLSETIDGAVEVSGLEKNYQYYISIQGNGGIDVAQSSNSFTNVYSSTRTITTNNDGKFFIKAKLRSSLNSLELTQLRIFINNRHVSDFNVTTKYVDTTPDSFSFVSVMNVNPDQNWYLPLNVLANNGYLTVKGLTPNSINTISMKNTNTGEYQAGKDVLPTTWNSYLTSTQVQANSNGEILVSIRNKSSDLFDTETKATLVINNLEYDFIIKTRKADNVPDTFNIQRISVDGGTEGISNVVKITGLEPNYAIQLSSNKGVLWPSNVVITDQQVITANNANIAPWQDATNNPISVTTNSNGEIWLTAKFTPVNIPNTIDRMTIVIGNTPVVFEILTNNTNQPPVSFEHNFDYVVEQKSTYTNKRLFNGIDNDPWDQGKLKYKITNAGDYNSLLTLSAIGTTLDNMTDSTNMTMVTKDLASFNYDTVAFHKVSLNGVVFDTKGGETTQPIDFKIKGILKIADKTNVDKNSNIKSDIIKLTGFDNNSTIQIMVTNGMVWCSNTQPTITANDLQLSDYTSSTTINCNDELWVSYLIQTDNIGNKEFTAGIEYIINSDNMTNVKLQSSYKVKTKNYAPESSGITHSIPSIFNYDHQALNQYNNIRITGGVDNDLGDTVRYKLKCSDLNVVIPSIVNNNTDFSITINNNTKYKNVIDTKIEFDITPTDNSLDGTIVKHNAKIRGYIDIPKNITAIANTTVYSDVVKISGLDNKPYTITSDGEFAVDINNFTNSNGVYNSSHTITPVNNEIYIAIKLNTDNSTRTFSKNITIDGITGKFEVSTVNTAPSNIKVYYSEDGQQSSATEITNINTIAKNSLGYLHFTCDDDFKDNLEYHLSATYPTSIVSANSITLQQINNSNVLKNAVIYNQKVTPNIDSKIAFTPSVDLTLPYNYAYYSIQMNVAAVDDDINGSKSLNKAFAFRVRGKFQFDVPTTVYPIKTDVKLTTVAIRGFLPNESVTLHVGNVNDPKNDKLNECYIAANSSTFNSSSLSVVWHKDTVTSSANNNGVIYVALKLKTGNVGLVDYSYGVQINDDVDCRTVVTLKTSNTAPILDDYKINGLPNVLIEDTTYNNLSIIDVYDPENHTYVYNFANIGTGMYNFPSNVDSASQFSISTKSMSVLNETTSISIYHKAKFSISARDQLNATSTTNLNDIPFHAEYKIKRKDFIINAPNNLGTGIFVRSATLSFKGLEPNTSYTINVSNIAPSGLSPFGVHAKNSSFSASSILENQFSSSFTVTSSSTGMIYYCIGGTSKDIGLIQHEIGVEIEGVNGTYRFITENTAPVITNYTYTITDYNGNTISKNVDDEYVLDENTDYRIQVNNITDKENHTISYVFVSNTMYQFARVDPITGVETNTSSFNTSDHIRMKIKNVKGSTNSTILTDPESNINLTMYAQDQLGEKSANIINKLKIKGSFVDDNKNLGKWWSEQGGYYAGKYNLNGKVYALIVSENTIDTHFQSRWYIGNVAGILVNSVNNLIDGKLNCDYIVNNTTVTKPLSDYMCINKLVDVNTNIKPRGFDDWYIPSQYEMTILYRRFKPTTSENATDANSGKNTNSYFTNETGAYTNINPVTPLIPLQTTNVDFTDTGSQRFNTISGAAVNYMTSTKTSTTDSNMAVVEFNSGTLNLASVSDLRWTRLVRRVEIINT